MADLPIKPSRDLDKNLTTLSTTKLIELAADVALVLAPGGEITEVLIADPDLEALIRSTWTGMLWQEIATPESQDTVRGLLEVVEGVKSITNPGEWDGQWVDVSHRLDNGHELPLRFQLMRWPEKEAVLAVGRDMRSLVGLRQQLLNAQLTVEQDYWRLRMVETRYRALFQMSGDGLMVVDDETGKVLEANAVANLLLAGEGKKAVGKSFPLGIHDEDLGKIEDLIDATRTSGRGGLNQIRTSAGDQELELATELLRQSEESRLLVRLSTGLSEKASGLAAQPLLTPDPKLDRVMMDAPDSIVLTDFDGVVVAANNAFVELTQMQSTESVQGRRVGRWLGRTASGPDVLITNLKRHREVKLYATRLRGELDSECDVEISARQTTLNGAIYFLMILRDVSRRISDQPQGESSLPASVAQITEQVGRVPLKELVRESTDVIEKLCIESALRITDNNRASAAEVLGLSRQSLYAKLKRFDLGEVEDSPG